MVSAEAYTAFTPGTVLWHGTTRHGTTCNNRAVSPFHTVLVKVSQRFAY